MFVMTFQIWLVLKLTDKVLCIHAYNNNVTNTNSPPKYIERLSYILNHEPYVSLLAGTNKMSSLNICYLCRFSCRPKQRKHSAHTAEPLLQFGTLQPHHCVSDTNTIYLKPRSANERDSVLLAQGDYQPIWEKPLPQPPNNDLQGTAGRSKKNNEDTYNMSLSSNSTDYEKKKYYVLDKDYMNMTMST